VNFAANASNGNITVYANNICGNGAASPPFAVTVTPLPAAAGSIMVLARFVREVQDMFIPLHLFAGATGYIWSIPDAAVITSGANTNSITVISLRLLCLELSLSAVPTPAEMVRFPRTSR